MIYVNKISLDCNPHSNDNENITQKAKHPLASVVKMYFLKVANGMERLLRGNKSEDFQFTSEVFDITEIYTKTDIFIAVLGINMMTSHSPTHKSSSMDQRLFGIGQYKCILTSLWTIMKLKR